MKVIDLLNKIANDEKVPKYVEYYNMLKNKTDIMMICTENIFYKLDQLEIQLNSRVEPVEEEKKIPEKINWKPKESMAGQLTQKEQIEVIARRTEKLKKEFNNLLDYLKSKGE